MNVNSTMNLGFEGRNAGALRKMTTFRVPGRDGSTVVTDIIETGISEKLTNLEYRVMQKGKTLEQKAFQNKKGFNPERICSICEEIQTKVKEGFDFLDELLKAQIKGGN